MKNEPKKGNTAIPMIIIGVVLVALVGGAWWLYKDSKSNANNSNVNGQRPGNTNRNVTQAPTNAPAGATPPNMLGSPTASVTVEEFADFQCPTCGSMHPLMKEIQSSYGSKIRFIFRNFPLPMHDKSYDAAVAAEAAGMQGKFWQMQDQLFTNQKSWSTQTPNNQIWIDYAEKIGLDIEKFKTDMAGIAAKSRVDQDVQRAKGMNVGSTPTVFVNGQMVPFEDFNSAGLRRIIDAELQKGPAQSAAPAAPVSTPANGNSNANSNSK